MSSMLIVSALAVSSLASPVEELIGRWRIDLRPTPDAQPYYQWLEITDASDGRLAGTFYGSPIRDGRINTEWGETLIAFATDDGSGAYYTGARLRDGRLEGQTHAIGRGFLMPWRAIPAPPDERLTAEAAAEDVAVLRDAIVAIHPGLGRYDDEGDFLEAVDALATAVETGITVPSLYREVARTAALLRCGHTRVMPPEAIEAYRSRVPTHLPFQFRLVDGRMLVTAVDPACTRLSVGDEVVAIEGRSMEALISEVGGTMPIDGRTDFAIPSRLDTAYEYRDSGLDQFMPHIYGWRDDFTLDVRTASGQTSRVLVGAISFDRWAQLTPVTPREFKDSVSLEKLDESTWLLTVGTFVNYRQPVSPSSVYRPIFRRLNEVGAENLIIDLRNNGGGSSDASWGLATFLSDRPIEMSRSLVRNYRFDEALKTHLSTWAPEALNMPDDAFVERDDGWFELQPWAGGGGGTLQPDPDRFTGNVTILTSHYNASGTTMLVATLQEDDSVRVVGQPTAGSAEGPTAGILLTLTLPHSGIRVNIPAMWSRSPVQSFEPGMGVRPDLVVEPSFDDVRAGRDVVLEAAR